MQVQFLYIFNIAIAISSVQATEEKNKFNGYSSSINLLNDYSYNRNLHSTDQHHDRQFSIISTKPELFTKKIDIFTSNSPIKSLLLSRKISSSIKYKVEHDKIIIAGPESFNPELTILEADPKPTSKPQISVEASSSETREESVTLEKIQTNFRRDVDNFGQENILFEPTSHWKLNNDQKVRLKTGFNSFRQAEIEPITNIPLQFGWDTKIGDFTTKTAMGIDIFNRLPLSLNLDLQVSAPPIGLKSSPSGKLLSGVFLSAILEHSPYKFNAQTLDRQITYWRGGPNIYWQIDRYTSLFSLYRLGLYNDGNTEHQTFSRLERKWGQFSFAANLFTWNYAQDLANINGYFSPPDFLVYNGEIAWQGNIFDFLKCRAAISIGKQRLMGVVDNASGYETTCIVNMTPNITADIGYTFSNVKSRDTGESSYNNRTIKGQIRMDF